MIYYCKYGVFLLLNMFLVMHPFTAVAGEEDKNPAYQDTEVKTPYQRTEQRHEQTSYGDYYRVRQEAGRKDYRMNQDDVLNAQKKQIQLYEKQKKDRQRDFDRVRTETEKDFHRERIFER